MTPNKLAQAMQLRKTLRGVPYLANSHVLEAQGSGKLEQVVFKQGGRRRTLACDFLACGFGLVPNTELATALDCAVSGGAVTVDRHQATSVPDIWCAGEGTGIGGVDLSLAEGTIAGLSASGQAGRIAEHDAERARWRGFARRLARTFALRPELRTLCDADTIVCRCEDVTHGELAPHTSWRSAKLQTRCGMGPCQGRICGGATDFLYGWTQDSVRAPLSPLRIESLVNAASASSDTRSA
jgi:NADPH-dependent 2,4-dienoyl-CoA reductase/sulfur reductase-like enzyme